MISAITSPLAFVRPSRLICSSSPAWDGQPDWVDYGPLTFRPPSSVSERAHDSPPLHPRPVDGHRALHRVRVRRPAECGRFLVKCELDPRHPFNLSGSRRCNRSRWEAPIDLDRFCGLRRDLCPRWIIATSSRPVPYGSRLLSIVLHARPLIEWGLERVMPYINPHPSRVQRFSFMPIILSISHSLGDHPLRPGVEDRLGSHFLAVKNERPSP